MLNLQQVSLSEMLGFGRIEQPVIIAGPCAVETEKICLTVAEFMLELSSKLKTPYVFKSSFDKANRTSGNSFRSIGFNKALDILHSVKEHFNIPILTDIHETSQVDEIASVVDVLQIPAFLCRQTDLIWKAGETGKVINIKKGQFMAPGDMQFAVEKVHQKGNANVFLTERGSSFGYHNLVVDMRSLVIMRQFAPVVFDVTHSIQMPGGMGGTSGGQKEFAPYLARAAAAVGVDGFFIETHPEPEKALSDGTNMIPLKEMAGFLRQIVTIWQAQQGIEKLDQKKNS